MFSFSFSFLASSSLNFSICACFSLHLFCLWFTEFLESATSYVSPNLGTLFFSKIFFVSISPLPLDFNDTYQNFSYYFMAWVLLFIFKKTSFISILQVGYFSPEVHGLLVILSIIFPEHILSYLWTCVWETSIKRPLLLSIPSLFIPWWVFPSEWSWRFGWRK